VTPSGHDEPDALPLSGPADQVNEPADPASEPAGPPPGAAGQPSAPAAGPVNSAGGPSGSASDTASPAEPQPGAAGQPSAPAAGPVNSAGGPSDSASEPASPAEPQPGAAGQTDNPVALPVAGFARQDGEMAGLPNGQAPPTAHLPAVTPWLEPGRHPGENDGPVDLPRVDSMMDMEARGVAAWFGDHKVLEGVSLKMDAGKVTALIGPSGCGKSTFLRILNRMHELVRTAALAGEVLLGGEDIYDPRQRPADVRRRIGMVFQKPNPFPAMSIYDNVASGLKLAGIKVHSRDQVVETSLRRAGLWNEVRSRLRTPGGALSGGQQQRLCIARSLAVSPEVLLMDEPCSALDPTSTRRIEETIGELADQVTIVIVTHNMQQAARVSVNCAFFLASEGTPGYIVESGSTEQLFSDPADPRTAAYIQGQFG